MMTVTAIFIGICLLILAAAIWKLARAASEIGSQLDSLNDNFLALFDRMDEKR